MRCAERQRVAMLLAAGNPEELPAASLNELISGIAVCCGHTPLKCHRLARGWDVPTTVEMILSLAAEEKIRGFACAPRSLLDWEAGAGMRAQAMDLLCRLYRTGPVQLGLAHDYSPTGASSPDHREPVHPDDRHVPAELTDPVTDTCRGDRWRAPEFARRSITTDDVAVVRTFTETFRLLDNKFGGGHTHAPAAKYLDFTVTSMLRDGSYTEEIGRELLGAAAQLAHLVGWSAYDTGRSDLTERYFTKALELAAGASDLAFSAEILAAKGHHAIHHDNPYEAIELARASQHAARKTAVPALLAEAFALEANGHALLGDSKACTFCLRQAEQAFMHSDAAEFPAWLRYFDERYLAARFAHCLRDLKDWDQARMYSLRAVTMSDDLTRARAFNTAVLATTYIETDLDQACGTGLDALNLATKLRSTRIVHYIGDFRRRLHGHHGNDPAVNRFIAQTVEMSGID